MVVTKDLHGMAPKPVPRPSTPPSVDHVLRLAAARELRAGVVAATAPGRRAARLDVLAAISHH
jgi:hypothetical protein